MRLCCVVACRQANLKGRQNSLSLQGGRNLQHPLPESPGEAWWLLGYSETPQALIRESREWDVCHQPGIAALSLSGSLAPRLVWFPTHDRFLAAKVFFFSVSFRTFTSPFIVFWQMNCSVQYLDGSLSAGYFFQYIWFAIPTLQTGICLFGCFNPMEHSLIVSSCTVKKQNKNSQHFGSLPSTPPVFSNLTQCN